MASEAAQCAPWLGLSAAIPRTSPANEAPEVAEDEVFREWFVWHMRRSLSPGAALTAFRAAMTLKSAMFSPAVRVPTLVIAASLHAPARPITSPSGSEAPRSLELLAAPRPLYLGCRRLPTRATMDATERFVSRLTRTTGSERVLATILFTDIVGSTELAGRLGDSAWRELLQKHHAIVRRELARVQGREPDTPGDVILRFLRRTRPRRSGRRCHPRCARATRNPDQVRHPSPANVR